MYHAINRTSHLKLSPAAKQDQSHELPSWCYSEILGILLKPPPEIHAGTKPDHHDILCLEHITEN